MGKGNARKSAERFIEETLYAQVAEEISEGTQRPGLWAKALANSEGDTSSARSLYIKYRVQSLKDEMILAEEKRQVHEREHARRENEKVKHVASIRRRNKYESLGKQSKGFLEFLYDRLIMLGIIFVIFTLLGFFGAFD